tara:strand:- start:1193 stop:2560 length:1368 start_codon:yes stop_codon:yes gene_type:complete
MADMQGLFGNLNNTLNNMPLSGSLGLLTTGVGLLEGQPIGQAVQAGLGTYQGLSGIEEDRKRKELIGKLVSEGGFSKQEQALIMASQSPAAVAAQIRGQKAAAAKPTALQEKIAEAIAAGFEKGSPEYNKIVFGLDAAKGYDPQSTLGKLAADFKEGLLSVEEYEAGVNKATYVAPAKESGAASTVGKIMEDFNAGLISEKDKNSAIAKATKSGGQAFTVRTADGSEITYGGSGGNSKLTEQQSKDLGFAARIPDELMEQLDKFDSALASYPNKLLDQDPTGLARGMLQNPDFQIAQTLSQQFLTPLIRKDTGAAIQAWETQLYNEMYFPRPGDNQEVIKRKRDARRLAVEGLRKGLPPLLRIQVDPKFAKEFAKLQNDVLPENSALRNITKDWAAGTQPQGSLPEQAQGSDVQLESGSGLSIASIPYSDLVNVDVEKLSDDELDIMLKRFSEGK